MKSFGRTIGVILACLTCISGSPVPAQESTTLFIANGDWPQWRGLNRDGKVTGFVVPASWPKELKTQWKVKVGLGDATPALVGDRLYVFTRQDKDETALCLVAASGKELWRDHYAAQAVTGAAGSHPGPRSSPTVAEGKVVTLGVGGVLSCLNAADGKLMWRKKDFPGGLPQFFTAMSPIVVDGMCIAHMGGKGNGEVVALDVNTGEQRWQWQGDGPAYASPVLMTIDGTRQVVAQTDKSLVALRLSDGKLLWNVATPVQGRFFNSATPIVDGNTVIYTGQGKGTKAVTIETQGDEFTAKPLWNNDALGTGFNTPVLHDGKLFGLSDRGNLFCIDTKTGKTAWTDSARRDRFGAIVDAESVILALSGNSELVAFKPSEKQYEELAKIKVSDTPTYAHPIVAGKRIFIKDRDTLSLTLFE